MAFPGFAVEDCRFFNGVTPMETGYYSLGSIAAPTARLSFPESLKSSKVI